jgi:hypothetical protein
VQGRGEREQDAVEKRDGRKADAQESLVGGIVSGIVGWLNENATARTVFANASLTVSTAYDIAVRSAGGAFSKRKIDDAKDAAITGAENGKAANEAAGQAEIDRIEARPLTEDWYEPSDTMLKGETVTAPFVWRGISGADDSLGLPFGPPPATR